MNKVSGLQTSVAIYCFNNNVKKFLLSQIKVSNLKWSDASQLAGLLTRTCGSLALTFNLCEKSSNSLIYMMKNFNSAMKLRSKLINESELIE